MTLNVLDYSRACEKGDVAVAQYLLDCGAEIQVHPVTGYSPLHAACQAGHIQCAQLMLEVNIHNLNNENGGQNSCSLSLKLFISCLDLLEVVERGI